MRTALALALAACSVPDKAPPDAAPDAPLDPTPLDTTIDASPPEFSNTSESTFRFSATRPAAMFECRIDDEAAQPCTSPVVRTLPDGTHTFSVRAIDPAVGSDATPAERVWTIDTLAPDTRLTSAPPAADNSVMARFQFTSPESDVTFDCSLDNAGFVACKTGDNFGPLGDGAHAFAVRAHDRAGNLDASPAVYAWAVDTSTPDTQIASGPAAITASTTASFAFLSQDAGGGATFTCSFDGSAYAACTSPVTYANLAEGGHAFAVRVRDAVGNSDPTPATWMWVVDSTPPVTTITGGPSGTVPVASASFTFASNEPVSTFQCSFDAATFSACTSPATAIGLAQGGHTFAVRAIDAAGHTDPSPATRAWTVDTIAPAVEIVSGPAAGSTSGPRVAFAFTASEGAVTCSFDGAPFAACASPVAVNLPAGPHGFAVRATDAATNTTTVSRAWTVACAAPDADGAAGLLHLDDTGQQLANAVAGGAAATLGDTIGVEPGDPASGPGRFADGLAFDPVGLDHVAWPVALTAMPALTLELWAKPNAPAGAREIAATADARVVMTVTADSPTTVHFAIAVLETGATGELRTAISAPVAAGAWHHVLASLAEPTLYLWVDGVRATATVHPDSPPALASIRLGGGTAQTAYSGSLDEVWLAQTPITADETALSRYCPL